VKWKSEGMTSACRPDPACVPRPSRINMARRRGQLMWAPLFSFSLCLLFPRSMAFAARVLVTGERREREPVACLQQQALRVGSGRIQADVNRAYLPTCLPADVSFSHGSAFTPARHWTRFFSKVELGTSAVTHASSSSRPGKRCVKELTLQQ